MHTLGDRHSEGSLVGRPSLEKEEPLAEDEPTLEMIGVPSAGPEGFPRSPVAPATRDSGQAVDKPSLGVRHDARSNTSRRWQGRRSALTGPIVAIANQKGGVGKTTTTISLAGALAEKGMRILAIDLDPQGNLTSGLGIDRDRVVGRSAYELIAGRADLEECAVEVGRGITLVGATPDLSGAQVELVNELARELRLAEALERVGIPYDVTFIDCPPSLGLLTVNGLVAADVVLIPVQCEFFALEGLGQLLQQIERIRRSLNRALEIVGLLLTMFDRRTRLAAEVVEEVRRHFGSKVFDEPIPRSVRLAEAAGYGEPITVFDPESAGAAAYRCVATELVRRLDAMFPNRETSQ